MKPREAVPVVLHGADLGVACSALSVVCFSKSHINAFDNFRAPSGSYKFQIRGVGYQSGGPATARTAAYISVAGGRRGRLFNFRNFEKPSLLQLLSLLRQSCLLSGRGFVRFCLKDTLDLYAEEMAKARDRTEDFRDAVRRTAISLGLSESKTANIMASFIMHKPRERTSFMKAALKTLESIEALEKFLAKHKKDYIDLHRITEQERDSIEHEVTIFIKSCKEQIDVLKNLINDEEANSRGWLGIRGDNVNADTVAHKHGVVLILSEKLHSVTSQFDKLRAVRFQDTINRVTPRKKLKQTRKENLAGISKSSNVKPSETYVAEDSEPSEVQDHPARVHEQILDDETRALQAELSSVLDAVQETETKMVEMSALNHLMSTHVLQQAQQIELLYEEAIEATKNVELGNKELTQAIQRNSSSRTFLLLFLFVLTFSIIFLDWYN